MSDKCPICKGNVKWDAEGYVCTSVDQEIISRLADALRFYATEGRLVSSDPYCSVWEGFTYEGKYGDKRPIAAGTKARSVLKELGLEKVE